MVLIDCHKCHVLVDDGKRKLAGRVMQSKDVVQIYFDTTALRDARIRTKVRFYDDFQGVLQGTCELLIRRNHTGNGKEPWMADCKILELRRVAENQRGAVRIKTNLEVEFKSSHHGMFHGNIMDLSVGGMQLVSRQILSKNERLAFSHTFSGVPLKLEAVVIRGSVQPDGRYAYGCRFVNMTDKAENTLGGFLFKKQQEKRKEQ